MKYEWRKEEKQIYLPKKIEIQTIPKYKFICLTGHEIRIATYLVSKSLRFMHCRMRCE